MTGRRQPRVPAPDVSVVMPVFNGEAHVAAAVRSVLAQADVAVELLVRDDGSTDGTLPLLRRLARGDARIRVASGPNEGPAACRNHCLRRASSAFVAFLDHDDLWPEGRLARQLGTLRRRPDLGAVFGETLLFEQLDASGRPVSSPRLRRVFAGLLQAGLFRRSALAAAGPLDPSLRAADDLDLILRMVEAGTAVAAEPEVAVHYRLHGAQWTADLRATGLHTARALARSLRRRRGDGPVAPSLPALERE